MGLAKRIIPCLDVTAGRVVKGVNFVGLRDAGDPVEIARRYDEQGADELTFLDITASSDDRDLILHIVEAVAAQVFIPLTVGGGVRTVQDVRRLLNAGADKVSINTAAVQNPQLVADAAARYGSQCIVVAVDAKRLANGAAPRWEVFTHGGRKATGIDALEWGRKMEALGAGEILLTSMDRDGTRSGFDLESDAGIFRDAGHPGDRERRGRQSRPPGRRDSQGPRRCGARGQHFSLRRIHGASGQGVHGAAWYRGQTLGN